MKAKTILTTASTLAIFGIGLIGYSLLSSKDVYAYYGNRSSELKQSQRLDHRNEMLNYLGEKLSVPQDKLQKTLNSYRQYRQDEQCKVVEEKLNDLVKNNKISQDQSEKLLNAFKSLQQKRYGLRNQGIHPRDIRNKLADEINQLHDLINELNLKPEDMGLKGYGFRFR